MNQFDREYCLADAKRQLDFFRASLNAEGGFDLLDFDGQPISGRPQELHTTTRLVHSYGLGKLVGFDDCDAIINAGMAFLWNHHRDEYNGGYVWSVQNGQVSDDTKLAYGHVFVLLAASTAMRVGHADADRLFEDISAIIDARFWDEADGLLRDEFTADWQPFSDYRGMNANMHGVEAFLAAFEVCGDLRYLERAGRILSFFTETIAPQTGWRIPEHYTEDWEIDPSYEGNPMFRPRGTTPGHSFELGRLLLSHWELSGKPETDAIIRAQKLIDRALDDAWCEAGGFVYTLTLDGAIDKSARYWWPVTEAISAVAKLYELTREPRYAQWYQRLWQFADAHLIDHARGGWYPELNAANQPISTQFIGKPDIYHALQADLFPLEWI